MTTTAAPTNAQVTAAFSATVAIGDAIRDLGTVPSGELYAHLMDKMSIDIYQRMIDTLKSAGLVSEIGHLLRWIGSAK